MSAQPNQADAAVGVAAAAGVAAAVFAAFETDEVVLDLEERRAQSSDVYSRGVTAAAVLRPRSKSRCAEMVAAANQAGFAVIGRGGGLSYTGGYLPVHEQAVILDTSLLDRIVEVNADDMYITVEAGVTWKRIYDTLAPLGLRLPFFGTFSGAQATVGGGLSNGALFLGTARHGTGADHVLGLEVVLADGSLLATGQRAFKNVDKPFYRTCGPDLTGLFTHESGAFGIKVEATFKLMRMPACNGHASFVFNSMLAAGAALSAVARTGAAEEAYVFDPESTRKNLRSEGLIDDAGMLLKVVRSEAGWFQGLVEGAKLVAAGRKFLPEQAYSLHLTCAARSEAALAADLEVCREACVVHGGQEVANSIPKAIRANLFPPPDGVLGTEGERWAALNAKVAHSDASKIMAASARVIDPYRERMREHGVWMTHLLIAIGTTAFSFEPVLRWHDEWLPIHGRALSPAARERLSEPAPNPAARELVAEIRQKLVELFAELGAASNQLGKTYPYFESLRPEAARFVRALKNTIDPAGAMNPGVLGLPPPQRNR